MQYLVAADIKRTEDDGFAVCPRNNSAVGLNLALKLRQRVRQHE
jgi:hypothetical protein